MKNGTCPKCGSASVYSRPNGIALDFSNREPGVFVRTGTLTRPSPVIAFVCSTCGYFEFYISDPGKLAEVAKTWQRVPLAAH